MFSTAFEERERENGVLVNDPLAIIVELTCIDMTQICD